MSAKTFSEGGKGRKQCPRCKAFIAANSAACPACHLLFERKEENTPVVLPQASPEPRRAEKKQVQATPPNTTRISGLRIPDGSNPVPLKGRDKTTLLNWAEAVRDYWLRKGYLLSKEGLCYYLMWEDQFNDRPKLYDAACQVINDNLTDEKPEPSQS
jgi:hypothetical protein